MAFFVLSFWLGVARPSVAAEAGTGPGWMRIVFVNCSDYALAQALHDKLLHMPGLTELVARAAAKNLYEYDALVQVSAEQIQASLTAAFPEQVTVELKVLPIGISEISVSPFHP